MKNMNLVGAIVAVAGLAVASANAGIAGWDIAVSGGTTNWAASLDPGSYTIIQNGNIYRVVGGVTTSSWSMSFELQFDPDPFVSSSFTIQNLGGVSTPFTVTVTAPSIALASPTSMTGSVSGTVGDGNGAIDQFGNGATVQSQGNGRPYYEALVDGLGVRTLLDAPRIDIAPLGLTRNINRPDPVQEPSDFLNEAGPAVASSIGIRNAFMLSGGDNASFTSTFLIVPSPAGVGLLGLAGLAAARRRR